MFSDNYFIKSEWSAKTITSNPLKPMSTLDISGGGNPNIEQAELFMSVVWALLTAYPKQFSVLIPVFYAMREQFLLEEITWLPPINDKPETFSEYGMTSEYQTRTPGRIRSTHPVASGLSSQITGPLLICPDRIRTVISDNRSTVDLS